MLTMKLFHLMEGDIPDALVVVIYGFTDIVLILGLKDCIYDNVHHSHCKLVVRIGVQVSSWAWRKEMITDMPHILEDQGAVILIWLSRLGFR